MNTRQTAIALGIIGLLATSITTQAVPTLVLQDNFDNYTAGDLNSQGSWVASLNPVDITVVDALGAGLGSGHGNAVKLGGEGITSIALPSTFVGSTRTLTFDIYRPGGGKESVGLVNSVPTTFGTLNSWGDGDSIFDVEAGWAYAFKTSGANGPGYDTLGVVGGSAWYTVTETITKYATYMDVSVNLSLSGGGASQWDKSFKTVASSSGYNFLTLQSYGGYVYVDNFKAYGDVPVPEPETVWMILAVLGSLAVTFRGQLSDLASRFVKS